MSTPRARMTGSLMLVMFRMISLRQRHCGPAGPARRAGIWRTRAAAMVVGLALTPVALAGAGAAVTASTILVLGDSISAGYGIQREQGWVSRLRERVSEDGRQWMVVNASISGETTGGGLARLPEVLDEHDPDVVVIELGGNDGLRGYPITSIRSNLGRMVELAKGAGCRVLLVGMQIPPNYGPRYTRAFAGVFEEVSRQHDVPLVPFLLDKVALQPDLMQRDGIHPTAAAQAQLLDTVWPHLAPLLQG